MAKTVRTTGLLLIQVMLEERLCDEPEYYQSRLFPTSRRYSVEQSCFGYQK